MKDKRKLHQLSSTYDVISMRRKWNFKLTSPIIFHTKETVLTFMCLPTPLYVFCFMWISEDRKKISWEHECWKGKKGRRSRDSPCWQLKALETPLHFKLENDLDSVRKFIGGI